MKRRNGTKKISLNSPVQSAGRLIPSYQNHGYHIEFEISEGFVINESLVEHFCALLVSTKLK